MRLTPTRRKRLKRLSFALISVLLVLLLLEVAARIAVWGYLKVVDPQGLAATFNPDPERVRLKADPVTGWAFDELGHFRWRDDYEFTRDKPFFNYRIIAVGDSVTYGVQVGDHQTFSAFLERFLNERQSGFHFEVLNAGVPGFNTLQILRFLQNELLAWDPDMVLLYANPGDSELGTLEPVVQPPGMVGVVQRLLWHSRLYYLLQHMVVPIRERLAQPETGNAQLNNIDLIYETCRRQGVDLMLVSYVLHENGELRVEPYPAGWHVPAPMVDGLSVLQQSGYDPGELFFDDVHMFPLGHWQLANAIYDTIVEQGLIQRRLKQRYLGAPK
ncbi:MAG: GDSL-type esterase/lipase family protein [Candidatus Alcyoniella australis]|nr:GDSL-type esterase/lipase family protein [Candidatus Alcyoniella australis]